MVLFVKLALESARPPEGSFAQPRYLYSDLAVGVEDVEEVGDVVGVELVWLVIVTGAVADDAPDDVKLETCLEIIIEELEVMIAELPTDTAEELDTGGDVDTVEALDVIEEFDTADELGRITDELTTASAT
jgi:hypothetical protein